MFFKKAATVFASVLFLAKASYAEPKVVTTEFINYVSGHFVGQESSADKRYDYRRNGIGKVVYGEGSGRVSALLETSGKGFRWDYDTDIWGTPLTTVKLGVDTSFVFAYEGSTRGKAQCYTPVGSSSCGDEWGTLHPEGRILIDVNADNDDGYIIHIRYDVISDDDGRPSEVVRLAMQNLHAKAVDIITTFAKRYKTNVKFVVY